MVISPPSSPSSGVSEDTEGNPRISVVQRGGSYTALIQRSTQRRVRNWAAGGESDVGFRCAR